MTWFTLLVDAVATYRLARLVSADAITEPIRNRIIFKRNGDPREWWEELLGCRWCVGIWIGFGVMAARALLPEVWEWPAYALAIATAAPLLAGLEDD